MTQYFFRKMDDGTIELSKFDPFEVIPEDVYHVNMATKSCNCPSPKIPCKHIPLVLEWMNEGEPLGVIYDDEFECLIVTPFGRFDWMDNLSKKD